LNLKTPTGIRSSRGAFTLVEMISAIAVLALLLIIILGIVTSTSKVADTAFRNGDTSGEATQVLDRIGADLTGMLIRPDVDQYYENLAGNDEMFFYSQTPGYFDTTSTTTQQSPVSLVGYRISSSANATLPPMLERVVQGMTWDTQSGGQLASLPFLTFPAVTAATSAATPAAATGGTIPAEWSTVVNNTDANPTGGTSFWHTFGPQVFRFEICYQLRDGSYSLSPPTPSTPPAPYSGSTSPAPPVPGSINDTVGIVVAVALLDAKSRQLVPAASWSGLINKLTDPSAGQLSASPPMLMNTIWNNALQATGFAESVGIPALAASQIKVYQRYYSLNAPLAR
jgi:hypothetical protein